MESRSLNSGTSSLAAASQPDLKPHRSLGCRVIQEALRLGTSSSRPSERRAEPSWRPPPASAEVADPPPDERLRRLRCKSADGLRLLEGAQLIGRLGR